MSEASGFEVTEDSLTQQLQISGPEMTQSVQDILLDEAEFVRNYAQESAPWADRTGSARDGLDVDVYEENGSVYLALFHTVDYGLWLEVIQSGKFAVIMPTLEALAPLIFKSVNADYIGSGGEE